MLRGPEPCRVPLLTPPVLRNSRRKPQTVMENTEELTQINLCDERAENVVLRLRPTTVLGPIAALDIEFEYDNNSTTKFRWDGDLNEETTLALISALTESLNTAREQSRQFDPNAPFKAIIEEQRPF